MGNDQYGDCVLACGGHLVGVETGNAGNLSHATLAQVLAQYTAIAGFNPDDPSTDTGVNIIDALNYWATKGFTNGTKSLGHLAVDATNKAQLQAAMWLFENLIFGIALPNTYTNPMPSKDGFLWGKGTPNPDQGHCVLGVGHDTTGIKIDTWALFGTFTYDAIAELCVRTQAARSSSCSPPTDREGGHQGPQRRRLAEHHRRLRLARRHGDDSAHHHSAAAPAPAGTSVTLRRPSRGLSRRSRRRS